MTKEGYTSNERIKEESDFLRGNISDLLHDGSITHFPSEEEFLLKFHGITQQDNPVSYTHLTLPTSAYV